MRRRRIVIPGITVLERLAGQACTEAEDGLLADVAGQLTPDLVIRMETLRAVGPLIGRALGESAIRQSSLAQVLGNLESRRRQYALVAAAQSEARLRPVKSAAPARQEVPTTMGTVGLWGINRLRNNHNSSGL